MNVAVFLPNWIGDVVMTTPALGSLRREFPHAQITGVLKPHLADVLAGSGLLDRVVPFDRRSSQRCNRTRHAAGTLRGRHIDLAILFANTFASALVSWLSGANRRLGYQRYGRRPLLTHAVAPPRSGRTLMPVSAVDYYLRLVREAGCTAAPPISLGVTPQDTVLADRAWKRFGWSATDPVITFNTGGSYGPTKHWPVGNFTALAQRIVAQTNYSLLVVCGPKERSTARQLEQACNDRRVRSLADEPVGIGLTKACIARSRLLVTTDSGPRHFAAAFDVPDVTLFGATDPAWSDNGSHQSRQLRVDLPCSPCGKRTCPLGHTRCLTDLTVDRVFEAVRIQLSLPAPLRAA